MNRTRDITEGVIWKQILDFFFPILLGTFFQQMYNTADTIIVGRFVGTQALAAVGATSAFISLVNGFFIGLSTGATVLMSQFFGAGDQENARKTLHTGIGAACGKESGIPAHQGRKTAEGLHQPVGKHIGAGDG